MAYGFDGNGNWTSELFPISDRNNSIRINATSFDQLIQQNLKESFGKCMTVDSQTKPIADIDANNYKVKNIANPTLPKDAVNKQTFDASVAVNAADIATNAANIATNTADILLKADKFAESIATGDILSTGAITYSDGVLSVVKSSTGIYNITLDSSLQDIDFDVLATPVNPAFIFVYNVNYTNATFTVGTLNSGGGTQDRSFVFKVFPRIGEV